MSQFLLVAAAALTVGAIVFGIMSLLTGAGEGLRPVEPDGRAVPLPEHRPLAETDLVDVQFDQAVRGYRMDQVDAALRRAAYDIGYKDELVRVLQAEVAALREGRFDEAEALRRSREAALSAVTQGRGAPGTDDPHGPADETPEPADDAPGAAADQPGPADVTGTGQR